MKQKLLSIKLRRDELERSIGGGLPTSSLVLIEGPDGAGKSIVSQRFCYGILRSEKTDRARALPDLPGPRKFSSTNQSSLHPKLSFKSLISRITFSGVLARQALPGGVL